MSNIDTEADAAPWVRVIIVNYNAGPLIQACVDALAAQTFTDFEAVVVDNASTDGSDESLRLPDSRFTLIRNESNIGFGAANNIGAHGCRAPWLATLNPDTVAQSNWLEEMHRGAERYPEIRMFGATLIDAADPTVVDGFGDALSIAGIPWRGGHGQPVADLPRCDAEVFSPCAAAALYARESFEAVGGFDESFYCYLEDVDLGFRLRLIGDRCMQLRHAIVSHHGSAITGRMSEFTIFHSFRNRLWMIIKNIPFPLLIVAVPANILCSLLIIALSRQQLPAAAALKGLWLGVTASMGSYRQRRSVQSKRRTSIATIASWLTWDLRQLGDRPVSVIKPTLSAKRENYASNPL